MTTPEDNHITAAAGLTGPGTVGVCLACGQPLTRMGPKGECLRCLFRLAFLPEEDPAPPAPEPLRYAHFEVEVGADGLPVKLGSGAMAVTYRARDTILHCTVALKVIGRLLAQNPVARARFLREARAAAQLHHPNVARVTHYGEREGECFYAMEFIDGETLEEKVRREGPLTPPLALEVAIQAARALTAAEACGVVHRDIKPSNLMLASRQGESGSPEGLVVKMIDFGVAKVPEHGIDQTRADFIGTPGFASPEQFADVQAGSAQVDTRSDIYSLGITLWYLLSGQTPFMGNSLEDLRVKRSEEPPFEKLESLGTPAPVRNLLRSMLSVDPSDRPQTARELLAAVQQCVRGEPEGLREPAQAEADARREDGFWIAALPFKFSGDPEIAEFAEGLTEEIVTGLSRFPYLRVIARSSTARYLAESVALRSVGNELGARYVLEGSLRQAKNRLRITVQLVDVKSGAHLWADAFDRYSQEEGIFELQDEITDRVIASVADVYGVLARAIAAATGAKAPETLTPYEAVWRFFLAQQRSTEEDHLAARIALEHAVTLQPGFADAWAGLAILAVDEYRHSFNLRPHPMNRALASAERAFDADPASQMANYAFALTQYFRGDLASFRAKAERALVLNSRCSYTLACLGRLFCYSGDWERGIQLSKRAIELSPHHPGWYYMGIIVNEYRLRRYAEALALLQRSNKPDYWVMHFFTAITQGQLGNLAEARTEVERTLRAWPGFSRIFGRAHLRKWFPNQPELIEQMMDGVWLAGFQLMETGDSGAPR